MTGLESLISEMEKDEKFCLGDTTSRRRWIDMARCLAAEEKEHAVVRKQRLIKEHFKAMKEQMDALSSTCPLMEEEKAEEKAGDEGLREFVVRIVERAKYLGHKRVDLPVRILEKSLEMYPSHPASEQKAPAGLVREVVAELERATRKFGSFNSAHEGYAVLKEEVDELWDEIKKKSPDKTKLEAEAKQVAAMGLRFAMDICGRKLSRYRPAEAKADEGIPAEICEGEDKLGVHLARPVGDKYMGLCMKYRVERLDGKPMPEGCIVLEWRDKNALSAIAEFSRSVRAAGYAPLADDLDKQLADKGYRPCADRTEELVKRLREWQARPDRDDIRAWIEFNEILADFEKGAS